MVSFTCKTSKIEHILSKIFTEIEGIVLQWLYISLQYHIGTFSFFVTTCSLILFEELKYRANQQSIKKHHQISWVIKKNQHILPSKLESQTLSLRKSVRIRNYSGRHFPEFGLNKERYGVSLRIQSKYGKIRTRTTLNTDTFHALYIAQENAKTRRAIAK